jgi:plasmid stabilization system protein ParE
VAQVWRLKLTYSARSLRHLDAIFEHIVADDPNAAMRVIGSIRAACGRLARFPHLGRAGDRLGTREWSMPRLPYVVVYRADIAARELGILAIFHTRRGRTG